MAAAVNGGPVVVAAAVAPRVSVILVLYGRADLAMRAVAALVDNTPACFELIIVDNASPDDALGVVSEGVRGATIISHALNVGFSAAISVGAMRARGEFLLLLNSDIFVEPGWLPPLLSALDGDRRIAGASPMLLNLDGTAQEAGSMLFASGETMPVIDEDRWAYDFRRSVPYVSAACLLLRRDVYTQLGGLDTAYGRGYFEDVEMALELEDLGLLLAHVPGSYARHVRGGSSNHDTAWRQMLRNRDVFVDRWQQRLSMLPHRGAASVADLRRGRDALTADRILIIDDRVPHVDRGSGDPRMAQIATTLALVWPAARITFLAASLENCDRYAHGLLSCGVELVPQSLAGADQWLQQRFGHFSAVFISRLDNVVRFRAVLERTQPQAMVVVDVEALYSRRSQGQASVVAAMDPAAAREALERCDRERAIEHESWKWASVVTCVCEEEAAIVRQAAPNTPVLMVQLVATMAVDLTGCAQRSGALFFGGFMAGETSPNTDSVRHLVDDLMPLLWTRHPELLLTVAGWSPPPSVMQRAGARVSVIGAVDSPATVLSSHRLLLVPERFGAGIKTRLAESMACGTPFVTSTNGANGLHLGDLAQYLVADDPLQFVSLASALIADDVLWQHVHEGLLQLARDHFSAAAFTAALVDVMAEVGVAPPMPA